MTDLPADPIGAAWLARTYGVVPMGRLPVLSQVGGRRTTEVNDGFRLETYLEAMRPAPVPAAHLQFHLRHEVPHFEFLVRLFARTGPAPRCWMGCAPSWTERRASRQSCAVRWRLSVSSISTPWRMAMVACTGS